MRKTRTAKIHILTMVLSGMILIFGVYWGFSERQKAVSQELTSEYLAQKADRSETILDRAEFVTKRDGSVDIAVLGSSVTRGMGATLDQPVWGTRLEHSLNQSGTIQAEVWNKGYNGFSTSDLLNQQKITETIKLNPDIIIFELCLINNNRYPQNDLSVTKEELISIMHRFKKDLPQTLVILTTANPTIYNDVYLNDGVLTYHQYNNEISAFIQTKEWNFIDIYSLMRQEIEYSSKELNEYLDDAVHPNGEGYKIWYSLLEERLALPVSELR